MTKARTALKVAMVSEHASPLAALGGADAGGQNVHVGSLAGELVRGGHLVVVHTRRDDPLLPPRVRAQDGVVVDHVDAGPPLPVAKDELRPFMGEFATVLSERWAEERPDVVHAHFWMSGLAAVLAARPLGIPVVLTFHALGAVKRRHQGAADTSPPDRLEAESWLLGEVDEVIATCEDEVCELSRLGPSPRGISVIPCGVDLSLFSPDGPVAPRSSAHRVVVVGRLVERKGVADAIEALRWLPGTELVIAGGPSPEAVDIDPDIVRLRAVASRCGVTERVLFLGRLSRSKLPGLLRSADAVVSVPRYEPFGIVPLEAMACGVPPVVAAVGGLRESVVHEETGLHVPPGDPFALAGALSRLFADPALARRLGAAGVERVASSYSWHTVASRTLETYRQVIARSEVPSFTGAVGR